MIEALLLVAGGVFLGIFAVIGIVAVLVNPDN